MEGVRICRRCMKGKPEVDFYTGRRQCKECVKSRTRVHWRNTYVPTPLEHAHNYRDMRKCHICKLEWPQDSFPGQGHTCKTCRRFLKAKSRYGLSRDDLVALYIKQNGRCFICAEPETPTKGLHIDHDHTTLAVRTLLCHHCNHAVGHVRESAEIARKVADYLDQFAANVQPQTPQGVA